MVTYDDDFLSPYHRYRHLQWCSLTCFIHNNNIKSILIVTKQIFIYFLKLFGATYTTSGSNKIYITLICFIEILSCIAISDSKIPLPLIYNRCILSIICHAFKNGVYPNVCTIVFILSTWFNTPIFHKVQHVPFCFYSDFFLH